MQSLPQRQQVQTVDGLVLDLEKEATAAHLTTLGLASEVETLKSLNAEYGSLIASRADSQQANPVESAKPIRKEMYGQYDELVSTAWAFSVATPSDALSGFIASVNKLIADTNTAHAVGRVERLHCFGEQADCRHEYGVQPADGAAEERRGGGGISRLAALS